MTLFKTGDIGRYFYIVNTGELELSLETHNEKKIYKNGMVFGELALIQKNKRSGTFRCIEEAELFCIDGEIYRNIIISTNKTNLKDRLYFLSLISIFSKCF
jgi:CRP-like cAMP-binding protein